MNKNLNVAILFTVLAISGCSITKMAKMASDQKVTVNPNPLELHGGEVKFKVSAELPAKMLVKDKEYHINVVYKYEDQELPLQGIVFKSSDFPNSNESKPSVSKDFTFDYESEMKSGNVVIKGRAVDPVKNKEIPVPPMPIAAGVITTSELVKPTYYPSFLVHGYNNQEELITTNTDFFFKQGQSVLTSSEKSSSRGKEFDAFIASKNVTKTVTITGTHSPEGSERINSKLSNDRAVIIEKYYKRQMNKYDYKGAADSIKFILKPVVDDWNELKIALSSYEGISNEEKSEILNIVNGPGEFGDKEKALQKIEGYKKVFEDVYPTLRSAKTKILNVKNKKTDAEILVLTKEIVEKSTSQDTLSLEELMYAASLTPDLYEKAQIYKAIITKSDEWSAHGNLGATYIAMAKKDASKAEEYALLAETQLNLSNRKKESSSAYISIASAFIIGGNLEKAKDALDKAKSFARATEETQGMNGVKGYLEIVKGNYKSAISSLSSANNTFNNTFNLGLAYLLNKDYNNASSTFMDMIDDGIKDADTYYVLAITQARKGNINGVLENLKKAIELKSEIKNMAIKDLEFKSYIANANFSALFK